MPACRALLTLLLACVWFAYGRAEPVACSVRARTEYGWVCGVRRWAENGTVYASFRGVPYAKQPLGELRFKELQPPEPWDGLYDTTVEGLICPQKDVFYGRLMQPQGMSEACIHANIHVPIEALPGEDQRKPIRELVPPYQTSFNDKTDSNEEKNGLPILVYIHGGGFMFGSGDADINGPEYLVSKGVIVITFNYRLGVFGFLSLNSTSIPGNNGLRDMLTLLRWVQRNAQYFGGDPDNVTLMGQSAGSVAAHLLSLSSASQGLFNRVVLMSGVATRSFITTSPVYAQFIATQFLTALDINTTDPEVAHRQLIETPIEKIMQVSNFMLDQIGITVFLPVVESIFPGAERIIEDDPEILIANGRGKDIPMIVGVVNAECETFRPRYEEIDILSRLKGNPMLLVPPSLIYKVPISRFLEIANEINSMYINVTDDMDEYVKFSSDNYFVYPAIKVAEWRAKNRGAPVFFYQFSYEGEKRVVQDATGLRYKNVGHVEDLTYVFKVNSMLDYKNVFSSRNKDDQMIDWMTAFITDFMRCSNPTCNVNCVSGWPPVQEKELQYQEIETPYYYHITSLTDDQQDIVRFFDKIYNGNS